MKKRWISLFLALLMVLGVLPLGALAEELREEPALLPTAALPELDYVEGVPYVGFATEQISLPEEGLYALTLQRTGNLSLGSEVLVYTVDVSAAYGADYVIKDSRWTTETEETQGTLMEGNADTSRRQEALDTVAEMNARLEGSGAAEASADVPADPENLSLAELKALQSGQPTREITESEYSSLAEDFLGAMSFDLGGYIQSSSVTRVVFQPGEDRQTLVFRILEDRESEGQEMFNLLLSPDDDHSAVVEANTSLSFVIEDDEPVLHSAVSFTAERYTAENGCVTVTVRREGALYSYVTVGIRGVADGDAVDGVNFAADELELVFQPYVEEAVAVIPVEGDAAADRTFHVELFDLKGADGGEILRAAVTVPAGCAAAEERATADDSYLDVFDQGCELMGSHPEKVTIGGKSYTVKYPNKGHDGTIMDGSSVIGLYLGACDGRYTFFTSGDKTSHATTKIRDSGGQKAAYLRWYSTLVTDKGMSAASFKLNQTWRYRAVMADCAAYSKFDSSKTALVVEKMAKGKNSNYIRNKADRAVRLGVSMFEDGKPYKISNGQTIVDMYVERTNQHLVEPEADFWGTVVLYKKYKISLSQPDKLSYRSGEFDKNGAPKMVSLSPAYVALNSDPTRYFGQSIQFSEHPAANNAGIYGTLTGYNIKPENGTAFFYQTNNLYLTLDDNLVKLIDDHTTELQAEGDANGAKLYYTHITVTPVYGYRNVTVRLLNPTSLPAGTEYHYADRDLEAQRASGKVTTNVFHVGDRVNLSSTAGDGSVYIFTDYERYQYLNPGDTAYDKNLSGTLPVEDGVIPGPTLLRAKVEMGPIFSDAPNYIEVRLDAEAQKYFTVRDSVPDSELPDSLKGKTILAVSDGSGGQSRIKPVTGRAYTLTLDETAENGGAWRPVVTIVRTGQKVNGFAADFIAQPGYKNNVLSVSAEPMNSKDYHYFCVDGAANYEAYALRTGSEELTSSPAIHATVSAGGWSKGLYRDDALRPTAIRASAATDEKGQFHINGIWGRDSDVISIVVDNNDVQQVEYVKLKPREASTRSFFELEPDHTNRENKSVKRSEVCYICTEKPQVSMPIRTFYSPYVSNVSFYYLNGSAADPTSNAVPIYENDTLILPITVNLSGAEIQAVTVTKRAANGSSKNYTAAKNDELSGDFTVCYQATIGGAELRDQDRFYVSITATPKGSSVAITYTALDCGLSMYTPEDEPPAQSLTYTLPNPYEDLPVVGDLAGKLESGKLIWQTIYADEDNPATSAYAQVVALQVDIKDAYKAAKQLQAIKNGTESESEAKKTWDAMLKDNTSDVYSYLNATDQAAIVEQYKREHPSAEDREAIEFFNHNPEQKARYRDKFTQAAQLDSLVSSGEMELGASIAVILELEYAYNPNTREHVYSGGQYYWSATGNVKKTWYWSVYGVPVYLNVNGYLALQMDGRYSKEQGVLTARELGQMEDLTKALHTYEHNGKLEKSEPWYQIGLGIKLSPGVGICGVLGARGGLKFTVVGRVSGQKMLDPQGGSEGKLVGSVGIDLLLFSFDYTIGTIGSWKSGIFDRTPTVKGTQLADGGGERFSIRSFDAGMELPPSSNSTLLPTARTDLVTGAMEYTRPDLVDLGDGRTMLLFLRNRAGGERSQANAAALVYAIRGVDEEWSWDGKHNIRSVTVEDDNSADSTPEALRIGDRVYIAWTSSKVPDAASSLDGAKAALQSTNIHMSVYDTKEDKILSGVYDVGADTYAVGLDTVIPVTNDNFVNSHVFLTAENGMVAVYYFKRDIHDADDITDLAGITNNYNTWARKLYDPATKTFMELVPGVVDPTEELIYTPHPTVTDPLETDFSAADFRYTDAEGVTMAYRIYSYTVDRDGDLETCGDRELWVRVMNLTNGRSYYPVLLDAQKENIMDARLTKLGDDVVLTWLSDSSVIHLVSATDVFRGLDMQDGSVKGDTVGGTTIDDLERIRALDAAEIAAEGWQRRLFASIEDADTETHGTLHALASGTLNGANQDFGAYTTDGSHAVPGLIDHQLVAGKDGNLYLFWTGDDTEDISLSDRELYGAAYYAGGTDEGQPVWSPAVRLTDFDMVIDELTTLVNADGSATLVCNVFQEELNDDGSITGSGYTLTELDFVAGDSLEIAGRDIILSDYYPVAGETVTAGFDIDNDGLLPAKQYYLTLNGAAETVSDAAIFAGESMHFTRDFTAGAGGAMSITAEVRELDGQQQALANRRDGGNVATVSTKSGALLDFGMAKIYNVRDEILPNVHPDEMLTDIDAGDLAALTAQEAGGDGTLQAALLWSCGEKGDDSIPYVAVVPVTNIGNLPGNNLQATATALIETTEEILEGDKLGTGSLATVPVKTVDAEGSAVTETVYLVIPLTSADPLKHLDDLGYLKAKLSFTLNGAALEETVHASRQFATNQALTLNGGAAKLELTEGDTSELEVVAYPWNEARELVFRTDNSEVASVDEDGVVYANGVGTCVVEVEDRFSGGLVRSIQVTVKAQETPAYPAGGTATTVTIPVSGEDATVNVKVEIKGDTATIKEADIDKVLEAKDVGTVTIDVSSLKENVNEVVIPGAMVEKIADAVADESNDADGLEIKLPTGTVSFDAEAVVAIAEQTDGKDLTLHLDNVKVTELTSAQQDAVSELEVEVVLDAYLTSNGQRITDFKGGSATVKVPYTLKDGQTAQGLVVWYVANDGTKAQVPATYDGKNIVFTVPHFSNYVIAYDAEKAKECPKDGTCPMSAFTDLDPTLWYHDGIHFCLENGMMNGMGDGLFDPGGATSRAMIVTILYRLEGQPKVSGENPFTDVADGQWYTDAVLWAAENKIVEGYGDGRFGPADPITREQLATILYRYAQSKGQGFTGMWYFLLDYPDASEISSWADEAMHWMVMKGIINGKDGKLVPGGDASRAEAATMLMRYCKLFA